MEHLHIFQDDILRTAVAPVYDFLNLFINFPADQLTVGFGMGQIDVYKRQVL